jgi:hypothetical protein
MLWTRRHVTRPVENLNARALHSDLRSSVLPVDLVVRRRVGEQVVCAALPRDAIERIAIRKVGVCACNAMAVESAIRILQWAFVRSQSLTKRERQHVRQRGFIRVVDTPHLDAIVGAFRRPPGDEAAVS